MNRIPPHSIEAEAAVIGAAILQNHSIQWTLKPDAFYRTGHQIIWRHILAMYDDGEPIDYLTLINRIKDSNELEKVGGAPYITELTGQVPSTERAEYYAAIVEDKYRLRQLIQACREAEDAAYGSLPDYESIAHGLNMATISDNIDGILNRREIMKDAYADIQARVEGKVTGIPTGYVDLDKMAMPEPGELVVIAGRPGMGKTSIAMGIAQHAGETGNPVAVFSLEMGSSELGQVWLAQNSGVSRRNMRLGNIGTYDHEKLIAATSRLTNAKIYVSQKPSASIAQIRAKALQMQRKLGVNVVVIDYAQLILPEGNEGSREQEVARVSRTCKLLAKEMNAVVYLLCQLNRSCEQRVDKKPQLSDLRESGSIEQDADSVWMMYRPEKYWPLDELSKSEFEQLSDADIQQREKFRGIGYLLNLKNRAGRTGNIALKWDGPATAYRNLEDERREG